MTALIHDEYLADALDDSFVRKNHKLEILRARSLGLATCQRCGVAFDPAEVDSHNCRTILPKLPASQESN